MQKILYTEDYDTALHERLKAIQKDPVAFPEDHELSTYLTAVLKKEKVVSSRYADAPTPTAFRRTLRRIPELSHHTIFLNAFFQYHHPSNAAKKAALQEALFEEQRKNLELAFQEFDQRNPSEPGSPRDCLITGFLSWRECGRPFLVEDANVRKLSYFLKLLHDGEEGILQLEISAPIGAVIQAELRGKHGRLIHKTKIIPKSCLLYALNGHPELISDLEYMSEKDSSIRQFVIEGSLSNDILRKHMKNAAVRMCHEYPEEVASALTGGIVWLRDEMTAQLMKEEPFQIPLGHTLPSICKRYLHNHDIIAYEGQRALAHLINLRKISSQGLRSLAEELLADEDARAAKAVKKILQAVEKNRSRLT